MFKPRAALAAAVISTVLVVAACGDDDDQPADPGGSTPSLPEAGDQPRQDEPPEVVNNQPTNQQAPNDPGQTPDEPGEDPAGSGG